MTAADKVVWGGFTVLSNGNAGKLGTMRAPGCERVISQIHTAAESHLQECEECQRFMARVRRLYRAKKV